MLTLPSLPAEITVSPLWSKVTLCTLSLWPSKLLTLLESTSTSFTKPSLLATASIFPEWLNATWLALSGPVSPAAIGDVGFLMSHVLTMPEESQEATMLVAELKAAWLQG